MVEVSSSKAGSPSEAESAALGQAGPLLRFASEHVKDLDPNLAAELTKARDAAADGKWTPESARDFWRAFNCLCVQIRPVTMDCLAAANRNIEKRRFFKTSFQKESASLKAARQFQYVLFGLLVISIPFQFEVFAGTIQLKRVEESLTNADANYTAVARSVQQLRSALPTTTGESDPAEDSSSGSPEPEAALPSLTKPQATELFTELARGVDGLSEDLSRLASQSEALGEQSYGPRFLRWFVDPFRKFLGFCKTLLSDKPATLIGGAQQSDFIGNAGPISGVTGSSFMPTADDSEMSERRILRLQFDCLTPLSESWPQSFNADVHSQYLQCFKYVASNSARAYYQTRFDAIRAKESESIWIGVITSFLLPILFGSIGAAAYVVRDISFQIRDTLFSHTSKMRHVMRVTLGSLAGLVVGLFTGLSDSLRLSPLAVAFLAGYGVEPLFIMFDSLVAKLKA